MHQQAFNELASCVGKSWFANWSLARHVVERRRKHGKGRTESNVYRCRACGAWHIGGSEALRARRC